MSLSLLTFDTSRIKHLNNAVLEDNTLIRVLTAGYVSVSLPKVNEVKQGTHCWRFKMNNNNNYIGWILLAMAVSDKEFPACSFDQTGCACVFYYIGNGVSLCFLFGYSGQNRYAYNESKYGGVSSELIWNEKKEFTELKWKETTENGEGKEYKLKDSTNFSKYNVPFVPHVNLYQEGTTIQIIKIPVEIYGIRFSETHKVFKLQCLQSSEKSTLVEHLCCPYIICISSPESNCFVNFKNMSEIITI
ncbi:hypothetical protein RFI_13507 [Reticulomyxa filosa]|uniref:Uncharacterized protein n=1 Tax=Reticulomyxa filosa TaxID=46433 RepID=X6NBJ6_RETFI|nr:hypothetical protein RFI_13507 [Reticulomyxa filosa]|eukprot:ETO23670.1 hypothetical protein RFI_13507 [Reticulomyxa filosa]